MVHQTKKRGRPHQITIDEQAGGVAMQNLPEYELQKTPQESMAPPASRPPMFKPWMLGALIVIVGLGGYLAYLLLRNRPPAPVSVSVSAPEAPAPPAAAQPPPAALGSEPMRVDLPPLDVSDAFVRKLVSTLSSHPRIVTWLMADNLVRNFTVVVVNISEGKSPAVHLQRLRPAGRFQVIERTDLRVDPRNYERYSRLAEAAAAIDPGALARLYSTLKPLIEQAYRDLGYVDAPFDRALERAIVLLLKTPVLEDPVPLKPRSVGYVFADPRVEALTPAQKQLLRFGSRNVRTIQQALRETGLALGIPSNRLPQG
jgi:hypothetical protein